CPECLRIVPAEVYAENGKVLMHKTCPVHGAFKSLLWSDQRSYSGLFKYETPGSPPNPTFHSQQGCPYNCGLCREHKQHTCLAILEVTGRCNLTCPVCIANPSRVKPEPELNHIEDTLKKLLKSEGAPTALQISGGEPTLRKDLPEIVGLAKSLGFKRIEIDTNGVELARNKTLAENLAASGAGGIYLQFDSITEEANICLRGKAQLFSLKEKAIRAALRAGLEVVLAATIVKGVNDDQVWDIIRYAVKRKLRGVNFQTFAASGRYPPILFNPMNRITIPQILREIQVQSGGVLKVADFIPIPCPDVRCSVLAYTIIAEDGRLISLSRLVDAEKIIGLHRMPGDYSHVLEALAQIRGSCFRLLPDSFDENFFSVSCHSLQDVWTVDLKRVKRCCIHELTIDGRLVPFCLYHLTSVNGEPFYKHIVRA
ncbi:radical SAM protein, partial [Candidatus Bathyarchaeota archaeon]|nr:radical SAM protein [Candidatus Bathyarchaeota archaeon]